MEININKEPPTVQEIEDGRASLNKKKDRFELINENTVCMRFLFLNVMPYVLITTFVGFIFTLIYMSKFFSFFYLLIYFISYVIFIGFSIFIIYLFIGLKDKINDIKTELLSLTELNPNDHPNPCIHYAELLEDINVAAYHNKIIDRKPILAEYHAISNSQEDRALHAEAIIACDKISNTHRY